MMDRVPCGLRAGIKLPLRRVYFAGWLLGWFVRWLAGLLLDLLAWSVVGWWRACLLCSLVGCLEVCQVSRLRER